MEKSYLDFRATVQNLETSLKAYRSNKEMYRVVATQLGILLSDRTHCFLAFFQRLDFIVLLLNPVLKWI